MKLRATWIRFLGVVVGAFLVISVLSVVALPLEKPRASGLASVNGTRLYYEVYG